MISTFRLRLSWLASFLAIMTCVAPSVLMADEPNSEQPLFYPPAPNQPRLQFLAKFSSVLDVSAQNKGFRDFVFGGEENEGHLINKPYGLDIYDGAIYVIDIRGSGYGVFDLKNQRSMFVRPGGGGSLTKPINISIDEDGTRYIADIGREQVLVYDAKDRFVKAFGEKGQFRPADVAIFGDKLYIVDIGHHQVHVLDKHNGEVLFTFGEPGSEPGQLFHPTNIAISPEGTVYVSDTTNFRVQEFDASGGYVRSIGSLGGGLGNFTRPKGLSLDREGRIYVVDAAFENIQIFAPDGGALMSFGQPGRGRANINLPSVVKIDYDNVKYFQKYAAPNFDIEYLVIVASQFGVPHGRLISRFPKGWKKLVYEACSRASSGQTSKPVQSSSRRRITRFSTTTCSKVSSAKVLRSMST